MLIGEVGFSWVLGTLDCRSRRPRRQRCRTCGAPTSCATRRSCSSQACVGAGDLLEALIATESSRRPIDPR